MRILQDKISDANIAEHINHVLRPAVLKGVQADVIRGVGASSHCRVKDQKFHSVEFKFRVRRSTRPRTFTVKGLENQHEMFHNRREKLSKTFFTLMKSTTKLMLTDSHYKKVIEQSERLNDT